MIANLLQFALNQRFVTIVLGLTLVGLGLWAFRQLAIEAYPDISDTQVVVITLYTLGTLPKRSSSRLQSRSSVSSTTCRT